MKGIKLGTLQQSGSMDQAIIRKQNMPLFLEEAELEKKNSDKRLNDPTTKAIVKEFLDREGLTLIENMTEKNLQNEASNNDSQSNYTAGQLLADCRRMQEILDKEDNKKWEKYN